MAKPTTYPNHRNCGLCGKPVRQHSDFLRVWLRGAAVLFHWSCFIREMRARDRRNAPGTEVMR